jgi:hypothetical protein
VFHQVEILAHRKPDPRAVIAGPGRGRIKSTLV